MWWELVTNLRLEKQTSAQMFSSFNRLHPSLTKYQYAVSFKTRRLGTLKELQRRASKAKHLVSCESHPTY